MLELLLRSKFLKPHRKMNTKHVEGFEDKTPMAVLMLMVLIKSHAFWHMLLCSARKEPCHWFPKAKALVIDPRDVWSICKEYLQRDGHDAWCWYCKWDDTCAYPKAKHVRSCTNPLTNCKYDEWEALPEHMNKLSSHCRWVGRFQET